MLQSGTHGCSAWGSTAKHACALHTERDPTYVPCHLQATPSLLARYSDWWFTGAYTRSSTCCRCCWRCRRRCCRRQRNEGFTGAAGRPWRAAMAMGSCTTDAAEAHSAAAHQMRLRLPRLGPQPATATAVGPSAATATGAQASRTSLRSSGKSGIGFTGSCGACAAGSGWHLRRQRRRFSSPSAACSGDCMAGDSSRWGCPILGDVWPCFRYSVPPTWIHRLWITSIKTCLSNLEF